MEYNKLVEIIGIAIGKPLDEVDFDKTITLKSLGVGSIALIQTIVLIEEELKIEVSEDLILLEPLTTVEDLYNLIQKIACKLWLLFKLIYMEADYGISTFSYL